MELYFPRFAVLISSLKYKSICLSNVFLYRISVNFIMIRREIFQYYLSLSLRMKTIVH